MIFSDFAKALGQLGDPRFRRVLLLGLGLTLALLFAIYAVFLTGLNWITGEEPAIGEQLTAKVRYRQADQTCIVAQLDDGSMTLEFDQPQRAVTPGQSVVLYDGDECLGGGIIDAMNAPPCREHVA